MIFEFKVYTEETGEEGTLQARMGYKAMEGLEQIYGKNYRGGLPGHVWRVAELGICFSGREAPAYKYREWRRDGRKPKWDFVGGEAPIEKPVEKVAGKVVKRKIAGKEEAVKKSKVEKKAVKSPPKRLQSGITRK